MGLSPACTLNRRVYVPAPCVERAGPRTCTERAKQKLSFFFFQQGTWGPAVKAAGPRAFYSPVCKTAGQPAWAKPERYACAQSMAGENAGIPARFSLLQRKTARAGALTQEAIAPERQFFARRLRLSVAATEATCGKPPYSASKIAACGALCSFGPAVLKKWRAKKPGNPSGLPGFLNAPGVKLSIQNRCFLASPRLKPGEGGMQLYRNAE